jgi:sigma-B regulation protein RsbU (phosphoserine phosphatase)
LPSLILPILGLYVHFFGFLEIEKTRVRDQSKSISALLLQSIQHEVAQQAGLLSIVDEIASSSAAENPADLDQKLSLFFANQKSFKQLILVNSEGHILWKKSRSTVLSYPSISLEGGKKGIEIRFEKDADNPDFFHFSRSFARPREIGFVGVFDLAFLGPTCDLAGGFNRNQKVIFFPNHSKYRSFECLEATRANLDDTYQDQSGEKIRDLPATRNYLPRDSIVVDAGVMPLKVAIVDLSSAFGVSQELASNLIFMCAFIASIAALILGVNKVKKYLIGPLSALQGALLAKEGTLKSIGLRSSIREIDAHILSMLRTYRIHEEQRIRNRVLHKAFIELFSADSVDLLLAKAVELLGCQTEALQCLFVPDQYGQVKSYAESQVFLGIHAWLWSQYRVSEVKIDDIEREQLRSSDVRTYDLGIKGMDGPIGLFKVSFNKTPSDFVLSLLHSLVSLVETTLSKHANVKRAHEIATELELAAMVQQTVLERQTFNKGRLNISYHFQPSTRLGGDWFYVFDSSNNRYLNFSIGDVSGNGLTQGLVATAVKGSMDMITALVQSTKGHSMDVSPSFIMTLLDKVMKRVVTKSEITMSCLAGQLDYENLKLKICNAGHIFPIIVRGGEKEAKDFGENEIIYLSKNQHSLLGFEPTLDDSRNFRDTLYDIKQEDVIFIYTDGLSGLKHLKSTVFSKILQRKLRQMDLSLGPEFIRNEIIELFHYYTQGKKVDDDVCFIVIQCKSEAVSTHFKRAV